MKIFGTVLQTVAFNGLTDYLIDNLVYIPFLVYLIEVDPKL